MDKNKKSNIPGNSPEDKANDVLETAELVRAANCLARMTVGIFFFSGSLCGAEVFSKDKLEKIQTSLSEYLESLGVLYSSLMGRYSALSASLVGSKDKLPEDASRLS